LKKKKLLQNELINNLVIQQREIKLSLVFIVKIPTVFISILYNNNIGNMILVFDQSTKYFLVEKKNQKYCVTFPVFLVSLTNDLVTFSRR